MPVSYLFPTPINRYRPPWYSSPKFYLPAAAIAALLLVLLVWWLIVYADLKRVAEGYDLTRLAQMESASVILDRNGKMFGQIYVENRETVPFHQLPGDLVSAVVAIEDNKFYEHKGYDVAAIVRAALKNFTSGYVRQGASTITQQLARNGFSLRQKTFRRKILEICLARRIEEAFGKQKIMELYLNRIYFGGGLYGAEAAARGYFGKPAREMTLAESATLAGLIKSPNKLSPWTDLAASREARNLVLTRMRGIGFISHATSEAAQSETIVIGSRQSAQGQTHAVDHIRQIVIGAVGWDRAMNEGYRIHTTIDSTLQKVAEESVRARLEQVEQQEGYGHQTYASYMAELQQTRQQKNGNKPPKPEYLQGAVIVIDNLTGGVLALVGGRDFSHNQYDRALQAKRPAGTAMTPFVFATAFEKGLHPGYVVEDTALDNRVVMIGGTTGILGEWGAELAENRYEGAVTAREALAKGKNGATIRIGMTVSVEDVLQICKTSGIRTQLRPYPSTFLGSSEMTLAELAHAYTIFPNGGWRAGAPQVVSRIEAKDGSTVWQAAQAQGRHTVLKPETAYQVHSCLVDALQKGTGRKAREKLGLKEIPAAGKTGTAYDFTDALFVGYDSAITCAVWAGFDKPQKIYRGAFGSEIALPVWVDVMNASVAGYAPRELSPPKNLQRVELCKDSGLLATDKCMDGAQQTTAYQELVTAAQKPTEPCNVHGEPRSRIAREPPTGDWPRAALASNTENAKPVAVRSATLLADKDPYNSHRSTIQPEVAPLPEATPPALPEQTIASQVLEEAPVDRPVMRAIPVTPQQPAPEQRGVEQRPAAPPPWVRPPAAARREEPPAGQRQPVEVRRAVPARRPLPTEEEEETEPERLLRVPASTLSDPGDP